MAMFRQLHDTALLSNDVEFNSHFWPRQKSFVDLFELFDGQQA